MLHFTVFQSDVMFLVLFTTVKKKGILITLKYVFFFFLDCNIVMEGRNLFLFNILNICLKSYMVMYLVIAAVVERGLCNEPC